MTPTRPCLLRSLGAFALVSLCAVDARADDALDELKAGYTLKQAGRCADAMAHFTRSYQLDPKPKAILNLADCEAQTGDLVDARSHAAQGRELATQQGDSKLQAVAADQLADIDKRLPRLTIRLAGGSPAGCAVTLDGRPVDPSTLGTEMGVNPGAHHVVASAPGFAERNFDINLLEAARLQLEVLPGPRTVADRAPDRPGAAPESSDRASGSDGGRTLRTLAYVSLGTGAVGLTIGAVFGVSALSKNSTLEGECGNRVCSPRYQSDVDSFNHARTASDIAYVVGFVAAGGGAILWLLSPSTAPQRPAAHLRLGPASIGVDGAF
jgi:hypothetical protein